MKPLCTRCNRHPDSIEEYVVAARELSREVTCCITPDDYVKAEEGTYNSENGHFLCTDCYIEAGMPSTTRGWRAK